ncbi:MAG: c-type cytochrome [Planctomycetaceae bacterium]|nr:c-type cytochrome [Planctomycetaceae bacterium]
MARCLRDVSCLLLAFTATVSASDPLSPQEAQSSFALHPECRIELVACEPDVIDPVHIAFAPNGKLWVVEYSDYPNGPQDGEPGKSRIRVLSDDDGDGRYTNPVTFAEGLIFANGLMHWRDGVIVTTNGQVLFMRDTDGDDVCDDTQQWFTGFATENPQLRCNHPTFGPDNKIYIANGLRGGKIVPGKDYPWPNKRLPEPLDISGRDFRFDPFTGEYETISGNGQFGLTFDDWGNRFACSNRNPCNHIVLEEEHLKRAPYLRVSKVFEEVSPAGVDSRLYPISRTWTTSNLHANQFTAACGVTIFRGNALPESFYGNSFTCEPTGNLVHRDILTPSGITFTSKPGREGIEFLATKDEWFRPVNLANGPDGALYVVDMYRAVIEHPQFVPDELKNRPDQMLGIDKGRIWRIVSKSATVESPAKIVAQEKVSSTAGTSDLVILLLHANTWQRDVARQLLVERREMEVEAQVRQILLSSKSPGTLAAAFSVLEGLGLHVDDHPDFAPATNARFSGDVESLLAIEELSSWDIVKIQVIAGTEPAQLCHRLLDRSADPDLVAQIAEAAGRKNQKDEIEGLIKESLDHAIAHPWQSAYLLIGLSKGLPDHRAGIWKHIHNLDETAEHQFQQLVKLCLQADQQSHEHVSAKYSLLGLSNDGGTLRMIVQISEGSNIFTELVTRTLAERPEPEAAVALVKLLPKLPTSLRNTAVSSLTDNSFEIHLLLDLVENGQLPALAVDQNIAKRLMAHADPVIKEKAVRLLKQAPPEDRVKVLAEYQSCLTLESDPLRGKQVFVKNCAQCHKVGDVGVDVAPDISDSRTKTPEYLLTNILDPNRAIDNNFFSYTVVDTNGVIHTGILASETGTSVTLKQPEGKTVSFGRADIEAMKNNGVSLMPVGLEKTVPPQDMADVISFIKNWRYLDGSVPKEVIR